MFKTLVCAVITVVFATGFIGCGGSGGGGSSYVSSPSTQRITVTVQFPNGRNRAHDTIASVWLTVTGDDMSPIVQPMSYDVSTFSATATVTVPSGTNRTFKVDAKTAADTIVYTGLSSGVQVVAGETVQVALSMATTAGTASVVLTQVMVFADLFDAETTGAHPGNWTVSEINPPASTISTNETVFFTDTGNTSGKSIEFIDTQNADFSSMTRSTHDAWEKVAFSWAQKADDISGHLECVFIGPEGEAGSIAFSPETLAGRIVLTTTGNSVEDMAQWDVGPWYTVRVELDTDADTYSRVYLQGILVATDVAFRTAVSSITGVTFRTGTTTSSPEGTARYIDNFKEYALTGQTVQAGNGGTTAEIDYTQMTLSRTLTGHTKEVYDIAFSPDGNTVASGSVDETAKLWDAQTGGLKQTITQSDIGAAANSVNAVAFSPNGNTLATGSRDYTVRLWDAETGVETKTFTGHTANVADLAYSLDGTMLASAAWDTTIKFWDAYSLLRTLNSDRAGHTDHIRCIAFSSDSRTLASAGADKKIVLWDPQTGTTKRTWVAHDDRINGLVFSPDRMMLVRASQDQTVKVWNAQTGALKLTLTRNVIPHSVAFSPDGRTFAAGFGNNVELWDVQTETNTLTLTGHTAYVFAIAFSPDGTTLASGSGDFTVKLWRVP